MKLEGKYIFDEACSSVTEQKLKCLCAYFMLQLGKIFAPIENLCIIPEVWIAAASVLVHARKECSRSAIRFPI